MKNAFRSAMFDRGRTRRRPSACAALAGLILVPYAAASGQVRLGPNGPYTPRPKTAKKIPNPFRDRPDEPQTFRLTLDAAKEPSPSLKYVFTPRHENRRPGNAAPYYYRAILSMRTGPAGRLKPLFDSKNYDRWMSGPIDGYPIDEVSRFLNGFHRTFENLQTASRREKCDWSWRLQDLRGAEAIAFIIEEAQQCRNLARLLILKVRVAIAQRRYADAVDWMRVCYKLAEDGAEPPTLINDLVGVAIAQMMAAEVRNLIASPKSPNLYWALSSLPSPMIDIRPAMQYEMSLPMKVLPALKDAETSRHTAAEWASILASAVRDVQALGGSSGDGDTTSVPGIQSRMTAAGLVLRGYPRAKKDLVEWGMKPETVDAMPVGQVVVIHQARIYRHVYQEMMKWTYLPYHEAYRGISRSEEKLKSDGYFGSPGRTREIIPITGLLLPATTQAYRATVRIDVRLAGLRVLEAIRMHSAENNGRLPDSLSEITVVPAPDNPATGRPFPYRVEGKKAVLELPGPPGTTRSAAWRLELTLR